MKSMTCQEVTSSVMCVVPAASFTSMPWFVGLENVPRVHHMLLELKIVPSTTMSWPVLV